MSSSEVLSRLSAVKIKRFSLLRGMRSCKGDVSRYALAFAAPRGTGSDGTEASGLLFTLPRALSQGGVTTVWRNRRKKHPN